jgi:hypothetical protein
LRPLKKTRASSRRIAPRTISAIGLIVCFVVVVAPDDPPSANTINSPQETLGPWQQQDHHNARQERRVDRRPDRQQEDRSHKRLLAAQRLLAVMSGTNPQQMPAGVRVPRRQGNRGAMPREV